MVQTLLRRDLAPVRDRFGLVILDEAHHCPAETFKSVVQHFAARYRIGLTATPTRKDRLHPVLFDVVGPIVHRVMPRTLVASARPPTSSSSTRGDRSSSSPAGSRPLASRSSP